MRYERAMSQHAAAREMVFLAEEGLMQKGCVFDHTWQEMLNHATSKVPLTSPQLKKMEIPFLLIRLFTQEIWELQPKMCLTANSKNVY